MVFKHLHLPHWSTEHQLKTIDLDVDIFKVSFSVLSLLFIYQRMIDTYGYE